MVHGTEPLASGHIGTSTMSARVSTTPEIGSLWIDKTWYTVMIFVGTTPECQYLHLSFREREPFCSSMSDAHCRLNNDWSLCCDKSYKFFNLHWGEFVEVAASDLESSCTKIGA